MLIRACGWLMLLEAMLVTGAFVWLLTCLPLQSVFGTASLSAVDRCATARLPGARLGQR